VTDYNFIIVGQGIAGSLLAHQLINAGQKVLVIDDHNPTGATIVSSGVMNPITGRGYTKTWLADEIFPFAESTFKQIEAETQSNFLSPLSILKIFPSVKDINDWSARCKSEGYEAYLNNDSIIRLNGEQVHNPHGCFEVSGGMRLDVITFIEAYRQYLKTNDCLLNETFDFSALGLTAQGVSYKGNTAQKIIFSEGAAVVNNPYFNHLPFRYNKGQSLIIDIPGYSETCMLKGEALILPYKNGLYYVGATYENNFTTTGPTEAGKNEMLAKINEMLACPYKVVDHVSGVRPTVKDRRPMIGVHPQHPQVALFNGMGTKGISLAPYFAQHFTEHLLSGVPLMPAVDMKRFG
jgi:glycine oxidase